MAIVILAAPVDDLWHRLFGLDVTLWSPPHLLGLAGSQVSNLGGLLIALEVHGPGWPRWAALAISGVFLLGTFYLLVDQSVQTGFHRGSVFFYTFPILGALAFTFALVLVARLAMSRGLPLALAAGALLVQISILVIGDVGFAVLEPVSTIDEAIAADPTSPVAVAHEMARRNGIAPGRSMILRWIPLLPAALMALADPLRRGRLAAAVFGLALVATSAVALGRLPALSHALPSAADSVLALVLALACAVGAGWCAVKVAEAFARATRGLALERPRLEPAQAATIKGASTFGVPVLARQIGRIDLVVAGSVAVDESGARLGKGGGYSDLEFALARSLGLVDDDTPVVTTVHELQVLGEAIPMTAQDVPLDVVVTPERVIRVRRRFRRPAAIIWKELSAAQLAEMPALARLARPRARPPRRRG